jgi:hypothetical protein
VRCTSRERSGRCYCKRVCVVVCECSTGSLKRRDYQPGFRVLTRRHLPPTRLV